MPKIPHNLTESDMLLIMLQLVNRFGAPRVLNSIVAAIQIIADDKRNGFDARLAHLASTIEATVIDFQQSID
ncbi:MAG: hypothetical protein L0287_23410 [Anaerolineae bacterium]|nr:hypothetical protein [Anaerolineae bacterium]